MDLKNWFPAPILPGWWESQVLSLPWLPHLPGVEQRPRRLMWCLENEWGGVCFWISDHSQWWGPWSLVTLHLQYLSWKPCLGVPLAVLLLAFLWVQMPDLPQVQEHRGSAGGIRAKQRLLMEEENGEAEADQCSEKQRVQLSILFLLPWEEGMGAQFRAFCLPGILPASKRT